MRCLNLVTNNHFSLRHTWVCVRGLVTKDLNKYIAFTFSKLIRHALFIIFDFNKKKKKLVFNETVLSYTFNQQGWIRARIHVYNTRRSS